MANLNPTGAYSRTLTAFFDTRDAAERAASQLADLGVSRDQVRITEGANPEATSGAGPMASTAGAPHEKGFWEGLADLFLPAEDQHTYAEGLRRGGYLVSAQVDEAHYDRALTVLDSEGAIDMDEREQSWRQSGWAGFQPQATMPNLDTSTPAPEAKASQAQAERDETIPVYEETAKIGKRDVSHGRVRLRSYVVETPVSEQVNLRNEQVQVERRPVDRPIASGDAVFKDRVIEAEERAEEAVIAKETRVKEEIGLRKTVDNEAQTVSDTVRRTEVDVQDERGGGARAFSKSTDRARIADHMEVIASDGTRLGTVDHLDGDRIKLAKSTSPDGQHHFVPLAWIDHVDAHVHLTKSPAEARASW